MNSTIVHVIGSVHDVVRPTEKGCDKLRFDPWEVIASTEEDYDREMGSPHFK